MPVLKLREEGFAVSAYFFNPNIHPQEEYAARRRAMRQAALRLDLPLLLEPAEEENAVNPEAWAQALDGEEEIGVRCRKCYRERLRATARTAAGGGFAAFCTSLLYSRRQNRDDIVAAAEAAAGEAGVPFLLRDFRPWWQDGIALSREWSLYRQKWCGCLPSRREAEAQRLARESRAGADGRPAPSAGRTRERGK
jgi:predicted adenine nucleotide alpha hydrolase (AANH) superfamily ATPase